jgi:calcineurin-like phosphoesterase family protein
MIALFIIKNHYISGDLVDQSKVYVAADLYLGHTNIIRRNNRPFMNVEEMNKVLLKNWNDTVCSNDIVFFLGDISHWQNAEEMDYWLRRLSGNIVFIKGEHDNSENMEFLLDYVTLDIGNKHFCLVHDPEDAPKDFDGWIIHAQSYSHDLEKRPLIDRERKTVNVALEATDYRPISLTEIEGIVSWASSIYAKSDFLASGESSVFMQN